ncbi:hypothetical protein PF005_g24785 [Phytophthora fragariae]|uniref:Uncharacterized protein n=1 Tax=Phytophthora fragariae TaxID=53985 RepID=A0A6A3RDU8_9STRA|nr:hypothetical protein PF003_g12338 [Phytophthora fragariae]KAE8924203.1 hypothetical protein PF009_g25561 [Phytophthora fragariae]KAE8977771.1 hypothetical protein PF011_g23516 [Phytophthora fragariae]KAE9075547.1 hypothetical protein PF010_g24259 [Phytophthora fragariae]KAE9076016.1 hypothetical protein PF007_g24785 [Phytophthora fragariae]
MVPRTPSITVSFHIITCLAALRPMYVTSTGIHTSAYSVLRPSGRIVQISDLCRRSCHH